MGISIYMIEMQQNYLNMMEFYGRKRKDQKELKKHTNKLKLMELIEWLEFIRKPRMISHFEKEYINFNQTILIWCLFTIEYASNKVNLLLILFYIHHIYSLIP